MHILAGLAFALVATTVFFLASGIEFHPVRMAVVTWASIWPTVLVLNFLIGPDRRAQLAIVGVYFGVLLAFCVTSAVRGVESAEFIGVSVPGFFQPLLLWALHALPSLFLLLFLNRTVRTIGPTVVVFVFVLLLGSNAAVALIQVEPRLLHLVVLVAMAAGVGGTAAFWSVAGLGALLAAWPAWRCAAFLRNRYAAKRTSDHLTTSGAIWLLQALMLSFNAAREQGALGAAAAVLPLLAWQVVLAVGLRPIRRTAGQRPEFRLLLLRVFGFGRRSRRLLDLLGARWRLIGSIDLIAAPDLASRTMEPASFTAFLRGRLAELFIQNAQQLQRRFETLDHRPDPDGRYRINPLFCGNDMWKAAVVRLMQEATLVVMDLRGFSPERQGCIYELQTLLDEVPVERLVFLVDRTTHRKALEAALMERWEELSPFSPNRSAARARLRLIDETRGEPRMVLQLLAAAAPHLTKHSP